jgi:hypothetical protein
MSLVGGVFVFLVFLLFACHLLLGLYARSVVAAAAFDGAQYLARHPEAGVAGEAGAEQTVRGQVGSSLRGVRVGRPDGDHVEVTVEAVGPRFLAAAWLPGASDTIVRTARVRIERAR